MHVRHAQGSRMVLITPLSTASPDVKSRRLWGFGIQIVQQAQAHSVTSPEAEGRPRERAVKKPSLEAEGSTTRASTGDGRRGLLEGKRDV